MFNKVPRKHHLNSGFSVTEFTSQGQQVYNLLAEVCQTYMYIIHECIYNIHTCTCNYGVDAEIVLYTCIMYMYMCIIHVNNMCCTCYHVHVILHVLFTFTCTCSSVSNTTYGLFSCVSNTTHGLFSNTTYMFYLAVHVQCISTCTSDVQCMYMYILIYRNINTLYFHSIL